MRFDGKVALITGAGKGIGRGIAEAFGRAGAGVAINFRSDPVAAAETVRRVREAGGRAITVGADVGEPDQVAAMFENVDQEFGRLDILVNNAAELGPQRPLSDTSFADWERVLRSNLDGAFLCSTHAARRMIERRTPGRIVNISSVHEESCAAGGGSYCVAKGGLRNLTRAFALELAEYGITVNDVAPGMILTPMNQRALDDADYLAWAEAQIPLRRAGTPVDVANMVLFLCSEEAAYCTGSTFYVDGGWMLTWPPV